MAPDHAVGSVLSTDVPPRLDALAWSRWHVRVILALGTTWALDGLEASLVSNLGPTLERVDTLALRASQIGLASAVYLAGQVVGALVFGHLADRHGRKRLFLVTLGIYLVATALSGATSSFGAFALLRFFAGTGIGGEYSAMNSAIDELVPARLRGRIDLALNGSYWVGVALGGVVTLALLDPRIVPVAIGWRLVFGLGAILGVAILLVRRFVPESPRWLLLHGWKREAERVTAEIERAVHAGEVPVVAHVAIEVRVSGSVGLRHVAHVLLVRHWRRALLATVLMVAQAFFYNAIFFSYPLILETHHGVPAGEVGLYVIPFALGNFLGPLLLGPLFDRVGRRVMIASTYALSGILLAATGVLFALGLLDAVTQTLAWCLAFFFASAAASSAYLTVSELFPVEIRGLAIAIFYAVGTGAGAFAPWLFGAIVETGDPLRLLAGYLFAAALMLVAAVVARALAVDAEGRSLEELSPHS